MVIQEATSRLKSVEKFTRLQISPPNFDRNSSMELNIDCKNRGQHLRDQIQAVSHPNMKNGVTSFSYSPAISGANSSLMRETDTKQQQPSS
ncbi:hypothetical protein RHGRI_029375 [Rhododendron griersonianum]|uniref:Uncharacterized protein n=1 Tax=Rhododendron griersonianum TaxID=479676 RepID=A0AAV6ILD2_9ERIC|nr:hypothetical protein RHGRI_029375 [Rhododendron griersonianum]